MDNLEKILNNFSQKKIVVVGDVMLDQYTPGEVYRISPEAPVPIVNANLDEIFYLPGGAANVAANIASLSGKVSLFGFVGKEDYAKILSKIMQDKNIKCFFDENSKTTVKNRIVSHGQQLLRVDSEDLSLKYFGKEIKNHLENEIKNSALILVSDYAKGAISDELMSLLESSKKRILIDPKPKNISFYKNSFMITPNEKEALEMSMQKDVHSAGRYLREKLNCNILVTRGEKGMILFSEKETEIPTVAKEVHDVTGAGDTVIAALSLALSSGANLEDAVKISNYAAGISVGKIGTYPVKLNELRKVLAK